MQKIIAVADRFRREEEGAALIEYSVLIGIITVATIAIIVTVGVWVTDQWTALSNAIDGQGAS